MLVSEFQYELPPERIAQEPLADRAGSRLLHLIRPDQHQLSNRDGMESLRARQDLAFCQFPSLLRPDDLLVVNNTRVFPARLMGERGRSYVMEHCSYGVIADKVEKRILDVVRLDADRL